MSERRDDCFKIFRRLRSYFKSLLIRAWNRIARLEKFEKSFFFGKKKNNLTKSAIKAISLFHCEAVNKRLAFL